MIDFNDISASNLGTSSKHYKQAQILKNHILPWEDGMRTDGSIGTYEWWYFDASLNDGSKLFIVFYTKHTYKINQPFDPFISVKLYSRNGKIIKKKYYPVNGDSSFSKERCEIQIGPNIVRSNGNTYNIHLEIEELTADITLNKCVPSWRPETGFLFFDEVNYFAWLGSVPLGNIDAILKIDNSEKYYKGIGYHDHNWGNVPMVNIISEWYWIHAKIGEYTVNAACITAHKDYGYGKTIFFMLAKGNQIIIENSENVLFYEKELTIDKVTQEKYSNELVFHYFSEQEEYIVTFKNSEVLKSKRSTKKNQVYLRFYGNIFLEHIKKQEVNKISSLNTIMEKVRFENQ